MRFRRYTSGESMIEPDKCRPPSFGTFHDERPSRDTIRISKSVGRSGPHNSQDCYQSARPLVPLTLLRAWPALNSSRTDRRTWVNNVKFETFETSQRSFNLQLQYRSEISPLDEKKKYFKEFKKIKHVICSLFLSEFITYFSEFSLWFYILSFFLNYIYIYFNTYIIIIENIINIEDSGQYIKYWYSHNMKYLD